MLRRALLAGAVASPLASPALAQPRPVEQGESLGAGWRLQLLIRWGDAVLSDAAPWNPAAPDAEAASSQFGWDARLIAVASPPRATDGAARAVAVVGHPSVDAAMAFPDGRDRPDVAAAMQGASIINLERQGGRWVLTSGGFQARRLTGSTLARASGPGAERLGGAITGIFGAGGGCVTPWGSVLLVESEASDWAPRLPGRVGAGHGWVVEIDPLDPQSIPVKHTALGQGAQDAAAGLLPDGRRVVYLAHPGGLVRFIGSAEGLHGAEMAAASFQGGQVLWQPLPAEAWQNLGAALAAARATRLPGGMGLSAAAGGIAVAGLGVLRDEGAGARVLPWPATAGMAALALDGRGQIFSATDAAEGRAATVLDPRGAAIMGAPRGASIGGLGFTPDGASLLTAIRAPGREPGRSYARPATRWPDFRAGTPPRSALAALSA
ncbi:MAG: DUF839 domain-containing protein [Alphaproteobacteria bacterium]|nr:DUF839 domain-containing protein [Alphaproteobacteria bacterium]